MGSSSASLFAVDTSLSLGARVYDSMPGQQRWSTVSSRGRHGAPPTYASDRVQKMYGCKFCPRTFMCPRALGGHQKAHRDIPEALYWRSPSYDHLQAQLLIAYAVHFYHPSARSVPSFFQWKTGASGLVVASKQLSSSAPAVEGYRMTGDGGNPGGLHEVNQEETADGIDLTLKL